MHAILSAVLLCAFVLLLLTALASVLRDLLSRDFRRRVPHERDRRLKVAPALDLDLACDLDHPLRR
jgi:hypothetical protein